ncbi:MAG: hypothetical protein ACR2HD_09265 [Solirubrobacteraceae bacterium]|nr:MAG: hypothetical protein DLM63_05275 [Solirubrobacterales bacterium]
MKARRLTVAALVAAGSSLALLPAAASASPSLNAHRVSINAAPNPALAGDAVVVFGRLVGPNNVAGQKVSLYHEVAPASHFSLVQSTHTGPGGFYEFRRLPGVVDSNRKWFVISDGAVSRTVREQVEALVTLSTTTTSTNVVTGQKVTFTGTVDPAHVGAKILLQRRAATAGDDWRTIGHGRIGAGGTYTIVHRFFVPSGDGDQANIRVLLPADRRNIKSPSEPIALQVQQAQNPKLTILSSTDPLMEGQSTTISGKLVSPVNAPVPITLLARTDLTKFQPVAVGATALDGSYSFANRAPVNNTRYRVEAGGKTSATLYEGVKDVVTATASTTKVQLGQKVTFTGSVSPDKTGHILYLQRLGHDGDYHTVQIGFVGAKSLYSITHRVIALGTGVGHFRVFVPGGPENQGGASTSIAITITPNTTPLGG